jgi:hypothetical protein
MNAFISHMTFLAADGPNHRAGASGGNPSQGLSPAYDRVTARQLRSVRRDYREGQQVRSPLRDPFISAGEGVRLSRLERNTEGLLYLCKSSFCHS